MNNRQADLVWLKKSDLSKYKLIFIISAVCNHVGFCSATTYCFLCRRRIDFGALVSAA